MPTPTLDPNSVVDYLKGAGQGYSINDRATLATKYGIVKTPQEYISLAGNNGDANTKLLAALKADAAKTGGATTGITSPAGVTSPADAASFINGNQENDFADASKKNTVDEPPVRTSTQTYQDMFADLKKSITTGLPDKPATPSFLDTYKTARDTYGITDLETGLNDLKKQAQAIKDANAARKSTEQGKAVAMNVIEGRISEEDKQDQIRLDAINREIEDTSNQLNTKYNLVNTLMTYGKMDYDNAVDTYDKQFSQNLQLFNTVKGIADSEKSDEERKQDNARANLQIIYNQASSGGLNFDALSADEKVNITKLETQAGLPVGFYQSLQNKNPKSDILSTTTRDVGGAKYADVIMKNADGSLSTKSIYLGGVDKGGSGDLSTSELLMAARAKISPQIQAQRGADGYVSPENYTKARDAWTNTGLSAEDFDKTFKQYANPESYAKLGINF